jgi:hypothetical protein
MHGHMNVKDKISFTCRKSNPESSSQSRWIFFRAILLFPALNQSLASYEFKGDRRAKHDCDTVGVTQGTGQFVSRYDKWLSFGIDHVQSSEDSGVIKSELFLLEAKQRTHSDPSRTKLNLSCLKTHFVPRSKHSLPGL